MQTVYCVDIAARCPKIVAYSGVYSQTIDRRLFRTLIDAETWLGQYRLALSDLTRVTLATPTTLPAIPYKRRYMALTLMGEKGMTRRTSRKLWPKGTVFRFHDQTYSVGVRLRRIYQVEPGVYQYDYQLL